MGRGGGRKPRIWELGTEAHGLAISDRHIDEQVARLRAVADASTGNLLELESLETLQLVRATTFTGTTRPAVTEALAALDRLLVLQPRLAAFVDQLERRWRRSPKPRRDERDEVERLLTDASIPLPVRVIELDDRSLFTPAEVTEHVTVDALIATLDDLFEVARSTLLDVDDVWERRLAEVTELRRQLAAARRRAPDLGEPTESIAAADRRLATLAAQLSTDPLGSAAALDEGLAAEVDAITHHLDHVEQLRRELPADLQAAGTRLADIVRRSDEAAAAADEATADVEGIEVPRLDRAALHDERTGLIPWLQRLRELSGEGRWRAARVGLDRWIIAADAVAQELARSLAVSRTALDRRDELRGRLASYASIAGAALDDDPEIGRLHDAARASLYLGRADLDEAADQVRRFVVAVRSTR